MFRGGCARGVIPSIVGADTKFNVVRRRVMRIDIAGVGRAACVVLADLKESAHVL